MDAALERQVGGGHYKDMGIQPIEFHKANTTHDEFIASLQKDVLKYTYRKKDNRIQDWRKAIHYLEMMIEAETEHQEKNKESSDV